jgi:hypothetical protein
VDQENPNVFVFSRDITNTSCVGDRPRDMPQNRSSVPATPTSSHGYQSGTSTPEMTSGPTPSSPVDGGRIIPGEVRDYMRTSKDTLSLMLIVGWQKFYDDAVAEEKTMSARIVILGQSSVTLPVQQGWNTVGGKSATKGGTPWGPPNRKSPSGMQ